MIGLERFETSSEILNRVEPIVISPLTNSWMFASSHTATTTTTTGSTFRIRAESRARDTQQRAQEFSTRDILRATQQAASSSKQQQATSKQQHEDDGLDLLRATLQASLGNPNRTLRIEPKQRLNHHQHGARCRNAWGMLSHDALLVRHHRGRCLPL